MTLIREIQDRAACAAWSPIQMKPDLVVLGTKDSGAAVFEDTGGGLEIYDFAFGMGKEQTTAVERVGFVKTTSRFASITWTPYSGSDQKYPLGLIAAGMVDGVVHIWNPQAILNGEEGRIFSLPTSCSGPLKAIAFNRLEPFHVAVGGANGSSWILDLKLPTPKLEEPGPTHQRAEITAISWNSQVAHIVATAAADGSVTVWDLKGRKAWCELRAEAGQAVADLVWNPKQGLHLLTASADDRNPVIKLWDLAASTSMPVSQMVGHQGAIFKLSWCPHDDSLLLSTSKDTFTFLWDLQTLQPIAQLPNDDAHALSSSTAAHNNPSALFAQSSAFGQKHMRYHVEWSPHKRGIALTCSLDRKVQAHSISSLATRSGRPPAWMKPSCGILSTSFGGTLLTCPKESRVITISRVVEHPDLLARSEQLERDLANLSLTDFCSLQQKQQQALKNSVEANVWGFLRVLFETNARQAIWEHLGFSSNEDDGFVSNASNHSDGGKGAAVREVTNGVAAMTTSDTTMSAKAKAAVQRALVKGDFEAAVETCFQIGNLADALLLASCGGADLWAKTQQRYFDESCKARPYLSIVRAVIRNQLDELIQDRDVSSWQETLVILSTYGASEEFPKLCIALGNRLDEEGDAASASLCYMCALSLHDTVKFWREQLQEESKKASKKNKSDASFSLSSLHQFVVKVYVFLQAMAASNSTSDSLSEETSNIFFQYAKVLADQGAFASAAKYCMGSLPEAQILRDRLYRGRSSQACLAAMGGTPPEFPYVMVNVAQSRGQVYAQQLRDAATYQKQQEAYQMQEQQRKLDQQRREQLEQQQQQQMYNQQNAFAQQQAPYQGHVADTLPPGWVALVDPSSGMTYYANQATGESSWEKPQMPVAPAPQPVFPQPTHDTPIATTSTHSITPKKEILASKYGDGFVTSASDPKLAYQYGNVGTVNPYGGAERPGTAAAVLHTPLKEEPPISLTPNLDELPLQDDVAAIRDSFTSVLEALKAEPSLTAADRRQLSEAEKGIVILVKKLARSIVSDELKARVSQLAMYLVNRDFVTASQIQTALVNSDWKTQKDWLKGAKILIQLASKKLPQAVPPGYY